MIETTMGSVEFLYCQKFTELMKNTGNVLFIPTKLIAMVQRPIDKYNIESGSTMVQTPGFKIVDITEVNTHGHERQVFDILSEWAIALGLTDSGAWRWIQGFKK